MMTIRYLKKMQAHSSLRGMENDGITDLSIIKELEEEFNHGNPFPKVLKELLFLAGNLCVWIDFGYYDSQREMQLEQRADLLEYTGITITRPHYFIDVVGGGRPLFIYLDEGDNPVLHQISSEPTQSSYSDGGQNGTRTIKGLIETRMNSYNNGYSGY